MFQIPPHTMSSLMLKDLNSQSKSWLLEVTSTVGTLEAKLVQMMTEEVMLLASKLWDSLPNLAWLQRELSDSLPGVVKNTVVIWLEVLNMLEIMLTKWTTISSLLRVILDQELQLLGVSMGKKMVQSTSMILLILTLVPFMDLMKWEMVTEKVSIVDTSVLKVFQWQETLEMTLLMINTISHIITQLVTPWPWWILPKWTRMLSL